jgi:hypothetical protein
MSDPRKALPEEAIAIVSAVQATLDGIRAGGSDASDFMRTAFPPNTIKMAKARTAGLAGLFAAMRSLANSLTLGTIHPSLWGQFPKLFRGDHNQPAPHRVMSGSAKFTARHLVPAWMFKLQARFADITRDGLEFVGGAAKG